MPLPALSPPGFRQCIPNRHIVHCFPVFLGDMFGYRRIYKCGLVVFAFIIALLRVFRPLQMLTLARIARDLAARR